MSQLYSQETGNRLKIGSFILTNFYIVLKAAKNSLFDHLLLCSGGPRRVVLLLPDGNLMVTEVDEEQFAALEFEK